MQTFNAFVKKTNLVTESEVKDKTKLLVDTYYTGLPSLYHKGQLEIVGWNDGTENALIRNLVLWEGMNKDKNCSVLDVGCGVCHFLEFLKNDLFLFQMN